LLRDKLHVKGAVMKAIITSHHYAPIDGEPDPHPHFGFDLEEQLVVVRSDVITLRTARVLVLELHHNDAFIKMLVAIVHCHPNDYLLLVGQVFEE
jgi:hypothetical protein